MCLKEHSKHIPQRTGILRPVLVHFFTITQFHNCVEYGLSTAKLCGKNETCGDLKQTEIMAT